MYPNVLERVLITGWLQAQWLQVYRRRLMIAWEVKVTATPVEM
jgi:hypothetical protein